MIFLLYTFRRVGEKVEEHHQFKISCSKIMFMWYVLIALQIHTLDIHGTTSYITYRSTGFILEGFPTSPDDLRCLASKGLFTDCAVVLQVRTLAMVVHSLMYWTIT